ncbi:MAG: EAL domain-containing protein [Firmicutes bacterium]|nr:EAL domain-containing protein [[Eubacterium] siraeum]MCM1488612.1 EAL domain-containing protein [Bacillota bacterium]
MTITNAPFDAAALVLLCLTLVSIVFRRMTKGFHAKLLIAMIGCAIAATTLSIFNLTLASDDSQSVKCLVSSLYYILVGLHPPMATAYTISVSDTWHRLEKRPFIFPFLILPYFAIIWSIIAAPVTSTVISPYTADGGQDIHFTVYVSVCVWYILCCINYTVCYRKQLGFRKGFCLMMLVMFSLFATISQVLFPHIIMQSFLTALSLTMASIGIQRPEDFVDPYTHLYSQLAYTNVMRNGFINGKHVIVVMLNIGNYDSIFKMTGYDTTSDIVAKIAQKITEVNSKIKGHADLYYLDMGRYRMVFNKRDYDKAEAAAALLLTELSSNACQQVFDISLTPYITVARCPENIESFKSLMSFGKDFHQKYQYSGRVIPIEEMYNPDEFALQNDIDHIIERALENRSFQIYYQPIFSVSEQRFVSAEALLRLRDEKYGFINPELIVTAAERNGTIHKIGDYVFEEVCKFISGEEYKQLGLDYIEVNLSVAQCMHSDLAFKILKTMEKYNVSPDSINLEITETAASYSQRVMAENMRRLSEAGISFSLDDYGTGYSNMKRVIQMPLKIVKLDKSLVNEQGNPKMWIFLQNTVKMLKDMKIEIVVEGIETAEMVKTFSDLKCNFIQGYYFSKPVCQKDFVKFISQAAVESREAAQA